MGWCLLSLFIVLGMALEGMHAFKLGWFLDLANETRRLVFRLAHAHGVLLGLTNIAFALSLPHRVPRSERVEVWISRCILLGSALLPTGFLLGDSSSWRAIRTRRSCSQPPGRRCSSPVCSA